MDTPAHPPNRHPAVMFEIIARDQARAKAFYAEVFGWRYAIGTGGFAYVHFPAEVTPLLGGIGQAQAGVPGFEPGHGFYLRVEDLDATIARAIAAGGALHMPASEVDGYRFAMIRDPEGNPLGLIAPFAPSAPATAPAPATESATPAGGRASHGGTTTGEST